ncbi:YlaH-like family protein [Pseudogracilibacillus auburnensis]|uniref:YlaH-like protein n=1 Tax=Pseudogracilibacillus auburnensis TaxID=1494959 RepID=A0A2V3WAR8_9BACI|nr:YlaH-like family protein [Pseudogracilibacillus auburnensis]MBO1003556.1 YlaH-like family protein [Pseudogracilibacillus auburnensis]PXW89245.1 YlaH-like protein [Pseudogracilibacillus auburnensis]
MDTDFGLIFNFIVNTFGTEYVFWTFYVLNLIFSVIAYKLGFARQLPLLKSIIVYVLLAMGVFIITLFSIVKYPMTETLIIISIVLGIYRYRLHTERKRKSKTS